MYCNSCNKEIPENSVFCLYCGSKQPLICRCGFRPPQDARFCPQCGNSLTGKTSYSNNIQKEGKYQTIGNTIQAVKEHKERQDRRSPKIESIKLRDKYYLQLIKEGHKFLPIAECHNDMLRSGYQCSIDDAKHYINQLKRSSFIF